MPRKRHFLTIGQKLTIALVALGLVLAAVSGVVVDQVGRMRDDARDVYEETKEATLASRLVSELHAARIVASVGGPQLARSVEAAREALGGFASASSRDATPESAHEREEQRLLDAIRRELGPPGPELPAPAALAEAERLALALADATQIEAATDYQDLEARAARATWTIWATVTACALTLVALLACVSRCITRPLRLLRDGAERLGSGDLTHRIAIPSRDEIGDLARAFDRMAESVGRSHAELEERVRARTAQFLHAAKLADLGTLAAGFAHEINNPLASIAFSAEGLERRLAGGSVAPEQQVEYLRTIASEARRARDITSRLLDLARREQGEQSLVDLRRLVVEHARLFEGELERRQIRLVLDVPDEVPPVRGNPAELTQALMNLVLNARDASPRGGTITVSLRAGTAVELVVRDQGPGIAEAHLERIFEPFFTTKPPGTGTGLGLALAHAIAESHGGSLRATNQSGGGARFSLTLPLARTSAA